MDSLPVPEREKALSEGEPLIVRLWDWASEREMISFSEPVSGRARVGMPLRRIRTAFRLKLSIFARNFLTSWRQGEGTAYFSCLSKGAMEAFGLLTGSWLFLGNRTLLKFSTTL